MMATRGWRPRRKAARALGMTNQYILHFAVIPSSCEGSPRVREEIHTTRASKPYHQSISRFTKLTYAPRKKTTVPVASSIQSISAIMNRRDTGGA